MIKLLQLLKELEKPTQIYAPGKEPGDDADFEKQGFRLSDTEIDPTTGASTSVVEYAPELKKIVTELGKYLKSFRYYKKYYKEYKHADIRDAAEKAIEALSVARETIKTLNARIEEKK